jgi:5-oxoprolinase (ATP-hydrolysing)
MLYERVIEAASACAPTATVERPLDEDALRAGAGSREGGRDRRGRPSCSSMAGGMSAHERRAAEIARAAGFGQVSVSHEVSPLMKMVSRGDTTVVDAYLSPILRRYVDRVAAAFEGDASGKLMFMQSSGGLTDARLFQGKDAILSGPAGGVVGAARVSEIAGFDKVIGFDMGGTSTDVCHYAGAFERVLHTEVAGVRMRAPMMDIHTVAAGGGSVLFYDGARMRVGPESAGADPGPACYGRGGPLAVTDANVLTGRLKPEFFPAIFGPEGDAPLDVAATQARFEAMAGEIGKSAEEVAEGFLRIAAEQMANAIKTISVQRGHDVTEYCLTVFGGAGAQFACAIADTLGMETCLIHPMASLLSAYGMGLADIRANREQALETGFDAEGLAQAAQTLDALARDAAEEVRAQGIGESALSVSRRLMLKVAGTDTALPVDFAEEAAMRAAFDAAHRARFGFDAAGAALVIEAAAPRRSARRRTSPRRAAPRRPARGRDRDRVDRPRFRGGRLARRALRAARGDAARRPADRPGGAGRAAHRHHDRGGLARRDHRA